MIDPKKLRNYAGVAPAPLKGVNVPAEEPEAGGEEDAAADAPAPTVEEILEEVLAESETEDGLADEKMLAEQYEVDEDETPPDYVEDDDIWADSLAAVEPIWDELELPWAIVLAVYVRLGGGITPPEEDAEEPAEEEPAAPAPEAPAAPPE